MDLSQSTFLPVLLMPAFGDRLRRLQQAKEPTVAAFYGRLGVSKQTIYDWFKSENPTQAALGAVLSAYPEVNVEWLKSGAEPMLLPGQSNGGPPLRGEQGEPPASASSTLLRLAHQWGAVNRPEDDDAFLLTIYHSIRPAAGPPSRFVVEADEHDADRHLQSKRIFSELLGFWPPDDMRGCYIEGWSMKRPGGGLDDGQLVLYRPVDHIESGRRYLLSVIDAETGDSTALCKRLQAFLGGGLKIISDNPGVGVEDEVLLPNGNDELVNQRTGRHVQLRIAGVVLWPRESDDEQVVRTVTRTIEQLTARGILPTR